MINPNTIWIGKDNTSQIDIRSHLRHNAGTNDVNELTGNVWLFAEKDWAHGDRLVEVGEKRFSHSERILQSVADCLVESLLVEATSRGVQIRSAKASIEGFFEPLARPGFLARLMSGPTRLELTLKVVSDADQRTIENLLTAARKSSPAFGIVDSSINLIVHQ